MKDVNLHQTKTHLSRLVHEAECGESFIIAKAGKFIVKVEKCEEFKQVKRLGFMLGEWKVPDDFNSMGSSEVKSMFYENKWNSF